LIFGSMSESRRWYYGAEGWCPIAMPRWIGTHGPGSTPLDNAVDFDMHES